jgi:hypothetical protein
MEGDCRGGGGWEDTKKCLMGGGDISRPKNALNLRGFPNVRASYKTENPGHTSDTVYIYICTV